LSQAALPLPGLLALALSACHPAPGPADAPNTSAAAEAPSANAAAAAAPTSGQIQRQIAATEAPPPPAPVAARAGERRCGWLSNPTPGNWWLFDGHGEWILAVQGGYQAPGMDDMPDMSTAGWEETNGPHGYGCACMRLTVDPATRQVTRIADAMPKPLKQCRADPRLPRP
jgi:uncharacterized protein DUF4087